MQGRELLSDTLAGTSSRHRRRRRTRHAHGAAERIVDLLLLDLKRRLKTADLAQRLARNPPSRSSC